MIYIKKDSGRIINVLDAERLRDSEKIVINGHDLVSSMTTEQVYQFIDLALSDIQDKRINTVNQIHLIDSMQNVLYVLREGEIEM